MRSVLDLISVYVTTLEKMKTDDVEGRRLCLGDYETIEEFYDACRKLHKDEEEPIVWFIDLEAPDKYEMFIKGDYLDENLFLLQDVDECEEGVIAYLRYEQIIDDVYIDYARENYIGKFENDYDLGKYLVEEYNTLELSSEVEPFFDYARYAYVFKMHNLLDVELKYYYWK